MPGAPADGPGTELFFHGISVDIEPATPPAVAAKMLASLAYRPGEPDTPVAGGCATSDQYEVMPTPARLDHRIVVDRGNVVLDPPLAADQPTVAPSVAWASGQGAARVPTSGYRLYLARYHATTPPPIETDKGQTHDVQGLLAWVLYVSPLSPDVPGCGLWGVTVYDAHTGAEVGYSGWTRGP